MEPIAPTYRPDWVSDDMFPFESKFFATPSGHRMHFVDEGAGEPVVFVHGNPAWSFEFRHLIKGLRSDYRCVAPDHIGFGLSSRSDWHEDHHPDAHARAFAALIEDLELRDLTLFMTDWGGPIGLDFARKHPGRVRRIVIANTWCWPVADDFHFKSRPESQPVESVGACGNRTRAGIVLLPCWRGYHAPALDTIGAMPVQLTNKIRADPAETRTELRVTVTDPAGGDNSEAIEAIKDLIEKAAGEIAPGRDVTVEKVDR